MIKQALFAAALAGTAVQAHAEKSPEAKFETTAVTLNDLAAVFIKGESQTTDSVNYRIIIGNPTGGLTQKDLPVLAKDFADTVESNSAGKTVLSSLPDSVTFTDEDDNVEYSAGSDILAASYGHRYQFPSGFHFKTAACYAGNAMKDNTPALIGKREDKPVSSFGNFVVCIGPKP